MFVAVDAVAPRTADQVVPPSIERSMSTVAQAWVPVLRFAVTVILPLVLSGVTDTDDTSEGVYEVVNPL